jgi:hypothetical protein
MPVESPKFDASIRDLRQIRGVTGDLEMRVSKGTRPCDRAAFASRSGA